MIQFDDAQGMSPKDISEIENYTRFKLPNELVNFFSKQSGGSIRNQKQYLARWDSDMDLKLDTFITLVVTKESIINNWENRTFLKDYLEWFKLSPDYVEINHLFPVFEIIDGTIYQAIGGKHNDNIFYVDNGSYGIVNIAPSLPNFCNRLVLWELLSGKTFPIE